MSPGETIFLIACMVVVVATWIRRLGAAVLPHGQLPAQTQLPRPRQDAALGLWILSSISVGVVMTLTLTLLASHDVLDNIGWTLYYLVVGYAVAGLGMLAAQVAGFRISDVIGRRNRAASTFSYATTLATTLAFAGANVGDGPGFQVVVFSAVLSVGTLWAIIFLHNAIARTSYRVFVDRDRGEAMRFGCLIVACGLILGRSVAGDWIGAQQTIADFLRLAWIAPLLAVVDAVVARITVADEPEGGYWADCAAGAAHIGIAVVVLAMQGMPQ